MKEHPSKLQVAVLAERVANVVKRLDEQIALSKTGVDTALTAINVAKSDQERTVTVAFSAAEKANAKTEESQKESNRAISILQNDVVSLKESRSQNVGDKSAKTDDRAQSNFNVSLAISIGFNVLMFLGMLAKLLLK
jgi:hypothetical protein